MSSSWRSLGTWRSPVDNLKNAECEQEAHIAIHIWPLRGLVPPHVFHQVSLGGGAHVMLLCG